MRCTFIAEYEVLKYLWVSIILTDKKTKLKLVKKGEKGTKESKLSLGYWLAFWVANMMCNDFWIYILNYKREI